MLQLQQEPVESIYGAPLSWERLPDRSAYRVADYSEGDITQVEDYAFFIDWMIDAQERLRRAVNSVLQTGEACPTTARTSTGADPFFGVGSARRPYVVSSSGHVIVVLSFHTAIGANTTTSPAVHSSEGTR